MGSRKAIAGEGLCAFPAFGINKTIPSMPPLLSYLKKVKELPYSSMGMQESFTKDGFFLQKNNIQVENAWSINKPDQSTLVSSCFS
jgi:hypothetical protein